MKSITLTIAFMVLCVLSYAQNRNELKGPEAKNYKAWKSESVAVAVLTTKEAQDQAYPIAKNKKTRLIAVADMQTVRLTSEKRTGFGLRSKNRNPWRK